MDKTYRESRFAIVGLVFSLFVFFLFIKIFIASIESGNGIFIIMMLVVCLTWLKVIYNSLNTIFKKIIIRSHGIYIYQSWKSVNIRWEEIKEFGRIEKKGKFQKSGEDHWIYYIIKNMSEEQKIKVGDSNFRGMDEIVPVILKKAKKSKFVTLTNTSQIPGMKKFKTISWEW